MTPSRKNKLKRAALSWLCAAALVSGAAAPANFPVLIPALAASAEAPESVTATIDLNNLAAYATNGTGTGAFEITFYDSSYIINIKQAGSYILTGSNLVNNSYVDVQICAFNCGDVELYCDNVYIKNSYGYTYMDVSTESLMTFCKYPFEAFLDATLKLSGSLAVETYINTEKDYFAPLWEDGVSGKITADVFTVDYKSNGKLIDRSYFLNGSTYSDKNDVLAGYKCREVNGTYFDAASVSAAAEVTLHADHSPDENGKCQNCGEVWIIDLAKLVDYKNGTAECPYGLSFNTPEDFSDILEVTFTKSGTYKFTGSNFINGAYLDVKFIVADGVNITLDCDDAFLKNDKGVRVENDNCNVENYPTNEPVYSHELVASGYFTLYNHVHPFSVGENATVNFTGKLFVDTFSDEIYVSMFDDYRYMPNIYGIYYTLNGSSLGKKFFVSGTEYDLSDYAVDFHCIKSVQGNSPGIYTFRNNWLNAYVYTHHDIPEDSDTCTQCGLQFGNIYTVTVDDTINTPTTHRVAENDTFDCPADPAAPVGKKFAGWYAGETEYNFSAPVTADITLTAHYEDSLVKSVELAPTSGVEDEYIEGNTFDPTGLEIIVTYDDDRSETIAYDESNTRFAFSPLLTSDLTTADTKVTVSYGTAMEGGSNSVDIPITVAAKQVTSVAIKTPPTKRAYVEGEKFNPAGLVITVGYNNGKSKDIAYSENSGITFAPTAELTTADTKVTITYGGESAEQAITVAEKQVTSVAVKTPPTKRAYVEGEKFNPAGLVITVGYNNGKSEDIAYSENSGITFAPTAELTTADTKVTITYGGKSAEQAITVAAKQVTSVAIKTPPTKRAYVEGEKFDPAGLVITVDYNNGKSEDIAYSENSGITFAPTGALTTADTKVTITYGGETAEQAITVAEKQVTSVAVKTPPTKKAYIEGEKFDPAGLVITVGYNNGKSEDIAYSENSGITFAPTGALTTADTKVTITYGGKSAEQAITVRKKSSGGSSGGGSRPITPAKPSIGGSAKSWSEIAADLLKLAKGSEVTIHLNGETAVPAEVIKAIDERDLRVTFVVDSTRSWKTNGTNITAPASADLTIITTASLKSGGLRGKEGIQFSMNNTNIPTDLLFTFRAENAGKFANLYKQENGKLVFVTCAKIGADGRAALHGISAKGAYVAMLCELSDLPGDMNNDGAATAADASAILKQIINLGNGANPLMADLNGDGKVTAADASEILKRIIGLS